MMRFMRERASETPPKGALTGPSREVPVPNGMIGTRDAAQSFTTSDTSASVSANTTASGGSQASQVSVLACCSRRAWLIENRSPKRAERAESRACLPSPTGRFAALARPAVMAGIYRPISSKMFDFSGSNTGHAEHRRVVASRGGQHESVADGILIRQPLPKVKHDTNGV